jgi:hypothetical protein
MWTVGALLALVLPVGDLARPTDPIVDCTSHSTWHVPDGWSMVRAAGEIVAVSPDKHAVLVRTSVASERGAKPKTPAAAARSIAARIAGVELTWQTPVVTKRNKYDHTTTVDGSASEITVRVIERDRGYGKDIVWVEIAEGSDRDAAVAVMDKVRSDERALVDHACACGTDCDAKH